MLIPTGMTSLKEQLVKFNFFILLLLLILNPYTVIGSLGGLPALLLLSFFLFNKHLPSPFIRSFSLLLAISVFGCFISFVNGIGQFNHVVVVVSIVVLFYSGVSLAYSFSNYGFKLDDLVSLINLVVIFNCMVIIMQLLVPELRILVESVLINTGTRDWSDGFRYRGLGSSGGAALSLLSPISMVISLYLYRNGYYSLFKYISFLLVVIVATTVIGRTGLVLCIFVLFVSSIVIISGKGAKTIITGVVSITCFFLLFIILFPIVKEFLVEKYGEGFIEYSFGFLLEGKKGVESEGTVSVLIQFISVLPIDFPFILTGYGFYGGSEFEPWTDSGFARTFLSVGIPFGVFFYFIVLTIFQPLCKNKLFCFLLLLCLFIGELKEPMLYSGYGARAVFLLIATFYIYQQRVFSRKLV
ncbi:hypothetical protein ACHELY_004206 [Vibrio vulnificus]